MKNRHIYPAMKMDVLNLATTVSILLLLLLQNTLARPGNDITSQKQVNVEDSSVNDYNNSIVSIENHILKGIVEPIDDRKISDVIFDVLNKSPDHVSQIDAHSEKTTTFREMKDNSIRLALWMKKQGIGPNDIIVECSRNQLDSYMPLLATFFVGAIFSGWESNIPLYKAQLLMKQYKPKLIFAHEKADILLEAAKSEKMDVKVIVFGKHSSLQSLSEIIAFQTEEEINNFAMVNEKKSSDVAVIMLSSGTTGFSKGIMLSSKSVYAIAIGDQSTNSPNATRVFWNSMVNWISGLRQLLQAVVQKKTRVIGDFFDENQLFQVIEKYKVNDVALPLVLMNPIIKSQSIKKYNLESLKSISLSGTKYNRNIFLGLKLQLPGVFIRHVYASTEAGIISASTPTAEFIESVGFVVPNRQVKFVDPMLGKALGPNERGELYVKSPSMMIGYYKNPVYTQQVLDEDGWYHTGDLGYHHENGEIFITDRMKEIIKYKNHQISPAEIETILLSHHDIEEAVVVSIPHVRDGQLPAAFVKKVPESKVTKEHLADLTSIIEDYKQLRGGIYFIDKFPLTSNGKISRNELKQLAMNISMKM